MISIVFPHLDNPQNNKLFELNLKMLKENTTCEYEVLSLWGSPRVDIVYTFMDWGFRNAKYDLVLWHSTDIVLAPGWNENIIKWQHKGDWIGLELVECGAIGVASTNIPMDFGRTANTFNRQRFESWVAHDKIEKPGYRKGFAWFSPSVFNKSWYIKMGGLKTWPPFPCPNDSKFYDKVKAKGRGRKKQGGCRFIVANSYAYHFQRGQIHSGTQPERI